MTDQSAGERASVTGLAVPASGSRTPAEDFTSAPVEHRGTPGAAAGIDPDRSGTRADRPRLREGVQLLGLMADSGFAQPQWLLTRNGQFIQVSELLYRVAEQADGARSLEAMAAAVTDAMPYALTAEHIRRIIDTKLTPLGVVATDDDDINERHLTGAGPLRVSGRIATLGPRVLDPVTGVLQALFRPWVAAPLLFMILATHVWLYLGRGVGDAVVRLIQRPLLMVPLFGIIVVAGVVHEFGHAAALRYGGGRCRTMGFGFYLIYPALYTDTSDAYRLGRRARIRVDLGGFYFHQVFALGLLGLSVLTEQTIWLLVVVVIDLEMVRQLLFPFVRFDGYWLLADLTGIPDLYTHFGAVLRRRLGGPSSGDVPALRPWPRRVFSIYAAVAVPVLVGLLVLFVMRAPTFVGLIWASWQRQADVAAAAVISGDPIGVLVPVMQMLLLALPLAGGMYLIVNLTRMLADGITAWRGQGHVRERPTRSRT